MSQSKRAVAAQIDLSPFGGDPRVFAKSLLKRFAAAEENARKNFEQFHPRYEAVRAKPKLADAQLVTARMLGYSSWPAFKHHQEHMTRCQRAIDSGGPAPDGELDTVHIRCGSDIAQGLQRAGYVGDFLEFSDPLCHGPVPSGEHDALLNTRADFIAQAYDIPQEESRARILRQWQALAKAAGRERVVLWFEHDSYDQLILARVLATLHDSNHPNIELICIDHYPGHPAFAGLGELSEVSLRGLWQARRAVTAADYALGHAVWDALRAPDPRKLAEIARGGTPAVPPMAGALSRHLKELPWKSDGLSLTQRERLGIVRRGATRCGPVFRDLATSVDPLPFMGDAMVWWEIQELAAGGAVNLTPSEDAWPRWGIELSQLGRALLEGKNDWIHAGGRTRWVGGVCCGMGQVPWRWDPREGVVLAR